MAKYDGKEVKPEEMNNIHEDSMEDIGFGRLNAGLSAERLLQVMLDENRRRDELLLTLLERNQKPLSIIPELIKNMAKYDGDVHKGGAWLEEMKNIQKIHDLPDNYMLETARNKLSDGAKAWYDTNKFEMRTWGDFVRKFREMFVREESLTSKWRRMNERIQGRNEPVQQYFHEKVSFCTALGLSFEEGRRQILGGLWSRTTCDAVISAKVCSYAELLHTIQDYEEIEQERKERVPRVTPRAEQRTTDGRRDAEKGGGFVKKTDWNKKDKNEFACYNCQTPGHLARNCPKPLEEHCFYCKEAGHRIEDCKTRKELVCHTCQKKGHVSKNCREKQQMVLSQKTTNKIDCYLKEVLINETDKLIALIDPGAAVCTIREDVAVGREWTLEHCWEELFGFGGRKVIVEQKVVLTIELDDVQEKVECLIVPKGAQTVDILIGRTFTEKTGVSFVKRGNTLYFGYEHNDPFRGLEIKECTTREITTAKEEKLLRKNEINFIKVGEGQYTPIINLGEDQNIKEGQEIGELRGKEMTTNRIGPFRETVKEEDLKIESGSPEDREKLVNLVNAYRSAFAKNLSEIGCTNKMEVEIVDDNQPVMSKPYRCSWEDREAIKERQMKNVVSVIVTTLENDEKWDADIERKMRDLNCVYNKTTGYTPFQCVYGYQPRFEDALLVRESGIRQPEETREEMYQHVSERVNAENQKTKIRYDKTRYDDKFELGDIVVVRRLPIPDGRPTKCQSKFRGPYVIEEVCPSDIYELRRLTEGPWRRTQAHVSQLKLYRGHNEEDSLEEETDDDDFQGIEEESTGKTEESEEAETESETEEWKPEDEDCIEPMRKERGARRNTRIPQRYKDYEME